MINFESSGFFFRLEIRCKQKNDRNRNINFFSSTKNNLRRETRAEFIVAWEKKICEIF